MFPGKLHYPHIFTPIKIGQITAKNRIKYAATETNFNTRDGFVTDKEIYYLEAQAKGGAGIVTTQGAYVDERGEGKGFMGMMGISNDKFIPGLSRIADVIRKHDALAAIQLLHCGREGGIELDYSIGPSAVPQKLHYFKPMRAMGIDEIKIAIDEHIEAAKRAKKAGFDIIELSGIVGYLISCFISKYTNKRDDEYGGSLKNRCRFMVEIISGIKDVIGDDMALGIRLCADELLDDRGGNSREESIETFYIAQEAGVDYVSVTVGWHESPYSVITRDIKMGYWLFLAKEVKKRVKIPVSMAFRLFKPEVAEEALIKSEIDIWEMCRPMIADPYLPNKILKGDEEDIIPCIACNLCFLRLYGDQPIQCTVRPNLGHEGEKDWGFPSFYPKKDGKKIAVIGGGVAGMMAASVSAELGNKVTLFEKEKLLGGAFLIASNAPYGDEEFKRFINYLENRLKKSGATLKLGVEAAPQMVKEFDRVIIATGARFVYPMIPNIELLKLVSPPEIMTGQIKPKEKVIIIGGDGIGLTVARYLGWHNVSEVYIIEENSRIGKDVNPFYLWPIIKSLKETNVNILNSSKILEIEKDKIIVKRKNEIIEVPAEYIVYTQRKKDELWDEIIKEIKPKSYEIIGDAIHPRRAHNAIRDGFLAGIGKGIQPVAMVPLIDEDVCTGCGICIDKCPPQAITLKEGKAKIVVRFCEECGICVRECKEGAIKLPW
ncbi:MAG: NADH oxidase [Deltaproteobacteria bacterium]|nr:MAG: NADH oxidase [Deltaproteobacteria bacterium]